ncbi:conserved hypothetical protein [Ricinus communis]|uniref:Uncharacterized protein n=1 Tax=Ricinus communis TaxID=3988 RepID=B9RJ82_RICCO|nr:conserved hypothetical protein [Ricinus communis]
MFLVVDRLRQCRFADVAGSEKYKKPIYRSSAVGSVIANQWGGIGVRLIYTRWKGGIIYSQNRSIFVSHSIKDI